METRRKNGDSMDMLRAGAHNLASLPGVNNDWGIRSWERWILRRLGRIEVIVLNKLLT